MERADLEADDRHLMDRFYNGDEEAFVLLQERWRRRLFGFFRRNGTSPEDAEDFTQACLVKLYVTRDRLPGHGRYDSTQSLAPFLLQLAFHLLVQARRGPRGQVRFVPLLDADEAPRNDGEPDGDLAPDLCGCISSLSPTQQLYVSLCGKHGLGELSHNEIAELLKKKAPQVSHLSKSTLAGLRTCMEGKGYR